MELGELIEKAALLHDIGKPVLRGFPGSGTHSQCGVEFLKPYVGETVEAKTVLRAVGHHHSSDLKGLSLNKDDITYIVYEADNLAAGTDRRANEDGTGGFCATMPLENVFNSFAGSGTAKTGFYLRGLLEEKRMLYPVNATDIQASSSEYKKIIETLKHNFVKKSPVDMTINELLRIMEGTMSYIPSSTAKNEVADISLYDHQRMTAAYAICMYRYFDDQNITDYRSMCYGKAYRELRNKDMYLLVSGDISGIQDFIYTIPSKGALKSLRGRSFYLELLLEHIADELLTAIHMSRSCLIYTGGGHFYMLLPNTQRMTAFLSDFATKMNDWFLQNFGSRLYIAMAWTPCSANEFIDETKGGAGNVFHRLSRLLSQKKLNRYDQSQLQLLISPKSEINNVPEGARECAVCHTSVPATELEQYEDDEENACQRCRNLLQLGKAMLDNNVIIISTKSDATALPLPGWEQEKYLCTAREEAVDSFPLPIERLYIKNQMYTGADLATYLWVGDYVSRGNQNNQVLDFEQLAMLSGGSIKNTGIKRLGVMRADIDNLGAAFIKGFSIHYDTLSRKSVLSRQLSLFFKRYINDICAGNVNGVNENQKNTLFIIWHRKRIATTCSYYLFWRG
jgi:CRISPR-associated protein Csm1